MNRSAMYLNKIAQCRKGVSGRIRILAFLVALAAGGAGPARPAGAQERPVVILALGDSLTAGYGLRAEQSFPSVLEARLRRNGHRVRIINAGVSGDTTAGGLSRLSWSLAAEPDIAIVELGANDGLRGLPPRTTEENLEAILAELKRRRVLVLFTGMLAPPNLGEEYTGEFNAIFPRLAQKHEVSFYPFFLEGVAGKPSLTLGDGLHPNPKGVGIIVQGIYSRVEKMVERAKDEAARRDR